VSTPTLDCRGLSCPLPVIKVMELLEKGASFAVLVDETIAVENISRFLSSRGITFTVSPSGEGSLIRVDV
jgi:tRNA 2-thiouridine synthesizing protein A